MPNPPFQPLTLSVEPDQHAWSLHDGAAHCYGCGETLQRQTELPEHGCLPITQRLRKYCERPQNVVRRLLVSMISEVCAYAEAQAQEAASLRQRLEEEKERYEHLLRLKTPRYVCADHNGKTPRDGACIMCQLELAQKERDCVKFELQAKEATRLKDNEYLLSRVSQAEAAMADFEKWLESAKSDAENQRDQAYDRADTQRCDGLALAYEFALAELQRRRSPRAEPQEK